VRPGAENGNLVGEDGRKPSVCARRELKCIYDAGYAEPNDSKGGDESEEGKQDRQARSESTHMAIAGSVADA